jgi:hypothetical protein
MQLLTLGNFSSISGKMKTGKSHLIAAITAAALSGGDVIDKFRGDLPEDKQNILYFDTEQGAWDFQWSMRKIVELSKLSKEEINKRITFYRLREDDKDTRISLIDTALKTASNVGLVIIDGIRELVVDINNPEESTYAMTHLMKWTDIHYLHILTVLHQNPAGNTGNKLRGHLGTESMNKAEVIISVNREEGASHAIIKADYIRRSKAFKEFALGHDGNNLPELIELDEKPKDWDEPTSQKMEDHEYTVKRLFESKTEYTMTAFKETAKNFLLMSGVKTSQRKITAWVEYWQLAGLIKISEKTTGKGQKITINFS